MAAGSVSGRLFDGLFDLYMMIALVVGGLVVGWLFYSLWRFRDRPGATSPKDAPRAGVLPAERGHVLWVYVMAGGIALVMFGLAFGTISAVNTLETAPTDEPRVSIDTYGLQFGWQYGLAGEGGIPLLVSNELLVPEDTVIAMNVTSRDVWHNYALPEFRIRVDAIPGTINKLWFKADEPGPVEAICVQICGAGHQTMYHTVTVATRADFDAWVHERSESAYDRFESRTPSQVLNVTIAQGRTPDLPALDPAKPHVLRVTTTAEAPIVLELLGARHTVAPGAFTRLYAPAGADLSSIKVVG